mmetsp:Transcript_16985/g.15339  ORF Transcript_16985/g.15339 Transcript_16985/m.15339 type:complete len:202 (+) Transcript_16985:40-645(+)|eukprot:CAMPEP_0196765818 /NCGR_PEP_ID=MMETSP1095-20130614/13470_1 /TAXON_ID=96789 ORGANISM="Chromulina nebulosa, Strain UTEXLB2642" /NCGR_SAMPLE_ID=MMETSP1095 /ASSEMBLY_ACC=CAM_ASM_000446 /LENGTH=201 /DNA_ID=CAMNT_0042124715 /DNA_START=38 /DNA_END=643 /DNA_ORIENTATION=-
MFRVIALLACLLSVVAFAPISRIARSSKLSMSFDNEVGVLPPTGFWDPLGLVADGDVEKFKKYREIELKHGRVSMLAVAGYLFQEVARLPGAIDLDGTTFESIPNGVAAIGFVPEFGWLQIIASIGYWDLVGWEDRKTDSGLPGDFNFGSELVSKLDPAAKKEILTKEIQNGRLAMLGIITLITHDIAKPAGEGLFVLHHF